MPTKNNRVSKIAFPSISKPFSRAIKSVSLRTILILCGLTLFLISCSPAIQNTSREVILLESIDSATATPTPFLPESNPPLTITPTALPETATASSTPQSNNAVENSRLILPENQISILVLGSDQRPNDFGYRTDSIILVTINFDLNSVNLTSFPRDLYIPIPGYQQNRINTVKALGGFELLKSTFYYNFGFEPDYYAMINFSSFTSLLNTIGGVDVNVGHQLTAKRDGYGEVTVYPGLNHMDGATALWYVRSRDTSNDLDRTIRQQEVLEAIFKRLITFDTLSKIPQLYQQFKASIETDLEINKLLELAQYSLSIFNAWEVQHIHVTYRHVVDWITPINHAQVLLPGSNFMEEIIYKSLNIK